MSSEQTWLSKKLSPMIEEYEVADVLLLGGALLTAVSLFTPLLHPLVGVGIVWAIHATLKATDFYGEERSPLKNGVYTEIDKSNSRHCPECGDKYSEKVGYKMLFIVGYEIFRVQQFESNECEECELQSEPEDEENTNNSISSVEKYERKREQRKVKLK